MQPELYLTYEFGEVEFRIYRLDVGNTYFLKVGAMGLEVTADALEELFAILDMVRRDKDFLEVRSE